MSIQYDCYPEKTHVAAGTIVTGPEKGLMPKVGLHLWVKECPKWYMIPDDGVERVMEFDKEFLEVLGKWNAEKEKGRGGMKTFN